MNDIFYVYVYLDLRKPGKFKYGEFEFDYEPFYIGKGSNNRWYVHLTEARKGYGGNQDKIDRINEILAAGFTEEDLKKYITKYRKNMNNSDACGLEEQMILTIGRIDEGLGPLTNHTWGGDDPPRMVGDKNPNFGKSPTEETKKKLSESNSNQSEETRRKRSESLKGKQCGKDNSRARAVMIDDIYYPAIIVASQELNINYDKLCGWFREGKPGYSYVGDTQEDIEARREAARRKVNIKPRRKLYGEKNGRARAVKINGVVYPAIIIASRELNIKYSTLCDWIRKGKPGYAYYE